MKLSSTLAILTFFTFNISWANFVYQGKLLDSANNPIAGPVPVTFSIMDPANACILYEEQHTGVTPTADGFISLVVGLGTLTGNDSGNSIQHVFQNTADITSVGGSCGGTYTPAVGDIRKLKVNVNGEILGVQTLHTVPQALYAENINEQNLNYAFIEGNLNLANIGGLITSAQLTNCAANEILMQNGTGTAWNCVAASSIDTDTTYTAGNGVVLSGTTFSLDPQGATSGQVLKWDGANWTPDADTDSGGTLTSLTAGNTTITVGGTATDPTVAVNEGSLNLTSMGGLIGTSQLANDAVISMHIMDGSVSTADIADFSITSNKIAAGAINSPAMFGAMGCSSGQTLKSDGAGNWACAADAGASPIGVNDLTEAAMNTSTGIEYLYVGESIATGSYSTSLGIGALAANSGSSNTAVGHKALGSVTSAVGNTAVGKSALFSNTGSSNTAIGHEALLNNTTGMNNTAIGKLALRSNTGDGNVAIGYGAGNLASAVSNRLFIANNTSTSLIEGDFTNFAIWLPDPSSKFGIGTNFPQAPIDIVRMDQTSNFIRMENQFGPHDWNMKVMDAGEFSFQYAANAPSLQITPLGNMYIAGCISDDGGTTSIGGTCASDARFKRNIQSIPSTLDKISKVNVVSYDWREENAHLHGQKGNDVGLIAQELEKIFPEMVVSDENGYKRIRYGIEFQLYQLKAVVEMSHKVQKLEQENKMLKEELKKIKAHLGLN